ncbi:MULTISPECIES: Rpn family recombination-promoting nuclease/putative transposase [Thermoanaerobacterium]|uniref:Transposase/invertase (TIGR01784 family) n=1 Tax=Thermoanaerobacterium butyriciformans TaxID=1702242 RepID=A0ABS4NC71_9THEO|nr:MULTISPECIES: Rpn family recombination-promoting nuclease/putative transposase [Thermoanaerobacterium]MBP2071268.1 putative transposase/invertase (TIGR01784 family) [Thermoanaerobacterium butyriciformans]MCP2239811.1 putative transposase/invertase (TIGR01784 family) [Thermoanaerobacterium thermosaccharolyticum]
MSQKYDITMKNIFSDMADDIMSYFLGLQYTKIDELNIEFARVERRDSDMIFKCTTDKGNVAVHIEFQSENDEKMPYRMLRYSLEIMEKHNLLPYQIVVYIGKDNVKMANNLSYDFGEQNTLDYRYRIINVGDIKYSDVLKTDYYDLYSLLPLMDQNRRKEEGEKYLERCVEAIKDIPLDINKKKDIVFKAEILSGIVFKKEVIEKVFSEVMRMFRIEESETYKMIIEKGIKQGIKEGMEKGIEKGEKEKSIKIAKKLLKEGMDIDRIAEITELSKEEIKKLMN